MALARPAFADQQHRFTSLDVTAFGQFSNLRRWNLRRLREVELFQRLQPRQLRIANPVRNRMTVALFAFDRQQSFQVPDVALVSLTACSASEIKFAPTGGTRTALQYCFTLACSNASVWFFIECLPLRPPATCRSHPSRAWAVRTEPVRQPDP